MSKCTLFHQKLVARDEDNRTSFSLYTISDYTANRVTEAYADAYIDENGSFMNGGVYPWAALVGRPVEAIEAMGFSLTAELVSIEQYLTGDWDDAQERDYPLCLSEYDLHPDEHLTPRWALQNWPETDWYEVLSLKPPDEHQRCRATVLISGAVQEFDVSSEAMLVKLYADDEEFRFIDR